MIADRLKAWPQYLMPGHLLSRLTHTLTRIEQPWFKDRLIHHFSRWFSIDLSDAVITDPTQFRHFNAFFTRALKPESRPIDPDPSAFISPVDGTISQIGSLAQGSILQAKGHHYTVEALLGSSDLANRYRNGLFTTIYLSPRDYHRIHLPCDGQLLQMSAIPGRLFSVNPATTRTIPNLFARNERVVAHFQTPQGRLAVVMVGAVNVGSIETVWAGEVTPPAGYYIRHWRYGEAAPAYRKGDEIGRFNMGSTVILLSENRNLRWLESLQSGHSVQMGQTMGRLGDSR